MRRTLSKSPLRISFWFFAVLLLHSLVLGSAALAEPVITISKPKGPPTAEILVSGSGWGENVTVSIYFDKVREGFGVTDGSGTFSKVTIRAPRQALPGTHSITAIENDNDEKAQQPFLVQTDWRQAHFSPDHIGLNPYENVLSPANVNALSVKWKFRAGSYVVASPAVVGGAVFVGSDDWSLYALDAVTGRQLWKFPTGGDVDSTPAVSGGLVYIGSEDHNLYALNGRTGSLQYEYNGGAGYSDVMIGGAEGEVYATSQFLFAFNTDLQWDWHSVAEAYGSPSTAYNIICVGGGASDATISARGVNGQIVWQYNGSSPASSTPVLAESAVYFALNDDLLALDASDGSLKWTYPTQDSVTAPVFANGVLYAGSGSQLFALDARSGSLLWSVTDPRGYTIQSLSIANGVVYYGTDGNGNVSGSVSGVDAKTGKILFSFLADGAVFGSPVVADGFVYFCTHGGSVYALGL